MLTERQAAQAWIEMQRAENEARANAKPLPDWYVKTNLGNPSDWRVVYDRPGDRL